MPHSNSEDKGSKFALNREIADLAMMLVHEDDSSNGINWVSLTEKLFIITIITELQKLL